MLRLNLPPENGNLDHRNRDSPEVIAVGGKLLQILSYSFFVYGWWMVATQAFNGLWRYPYPHPDKFMFFWLIQIPLAYLLPIHQDWDYSGVFWAVFFSETSAGIFTLWLFTRGRWKTQKV